MDKRTAPEVTGHGKELASDWDNVADAENEGELLFIEWSTEPTDQEVNELEQALQTTVSDRLEENTYNRDYMREHNLFNPEAEHYTVFYLAPKWA